MVIDNFLAFLIVLRVLVDVDPVLADYGGKCKTKYKLVSSIVYDTVYEKKCTANSDRQCKREHITTYKTKVETRCYPSYESKCEHVYKTGYKKCKSVPVHKCFKVPKKIHFHKPEKKCEKHPKKQCHEVPQEVPEKKCYSVPKQHCKNVPSKEPVSVPKEKCVYVPRKHCNTVPGKKPRVIHKKVPYKNCESSHKFHHHDDHHDGYGHDDHHGGYGHDDHHGGYGHDDHYDDHHKPNGYYESYGDGYRRADSSKKDGSSQTGSILIDRLQSGVMDVMYQHGSDPVELQRADHDIGQLHNHELGLHSDHELGHHSDHLGDHDLDHHLDHDLGHDGHLYESEVMAPEDLSSHGDYHPDEGPHEYHEGLSHHDSYHGNDHSKSDYVSHDEDPTWRNGHEGLVHSSDLPTGPHASTSQDHDAVWDSRMDGSSLQRHISTRPDPVPPPSAGAPSGTLPNHLPPLSISGAPDPLSQPAHAHKIAVAPGSQMSNDYNHGTSQQNSVKDELTPSGLLANFGSNAMLNPKGDPKDSLSISNLGSTKPNFHPTDHFKNILDNEASKMFNQAIF